MGTRWGSDPRRCKEANVTRTAAENSRITRVLLYVIVVTLLLLAAAPAQAGAGNFCPFGTCVIDNPVYVNVYWIASEPEWNAQVNAHSSTQGMTVDRIDKFTAAIIHSSYFLPLNQYKVYTPTFLSPSMFCVPLAPPPTMDDVEPLVKYLTDCVFAQNPSLNNGNTILNVFLPPNTSGGNWCTQRDGKHDKFGSPVEIVLDPTICHPGFYDLIETLSHEMVEAATDPLPQSLTGYKMFPYQGEIADQCSKNNLFFGFLNPSSSISPSFGELTQYWSNNANSCVVPFALTLPTILKTARSPQVCGTGKHMSITLSGTFGPRPWDLVSNQYNGQTLYVQAAMSGSSSWSAGNIINMPKADTVGFGYVGPASGVHVEAEPGQ